LGLRYLHFHQYLPRRSTAFVVAEPTGTLFLRFSLSPNAELPFYPKISAGSPNLQSDIVRVRHIIVVLHRQIGSRTLRCVAQGVVVVYNNSWENELQHIYITCD
jgi:hypothetical protein